MLGVGVAGPLPCFVPAWVCTLGWERAAKASGDSQEQRAATWLLEISQTWPVTKCCAWGGEDFRAAEAEQDGSSCGGKVAADCWREPAPLLPGSRARPCLEVGDPGR